MPASHCRSSNPSNHRFTPYQPSAISLSRQLPMYTSVLSALERVVKTEDKYGSKHCSGSALLSTGSIIKHSLNNGAVLTMENKVLPNALKLGGFVH